MPVFQFDAVSATGVRIRDAQAADSAEALRLQLASRDLLLVESRMEPAVRRRRSLRWGGGRADVATSLTSLSVMLDAGSPLERALGVSERSARRESTRDALAQVRALVVDGSSLADAMADTGEPFSRYTIGMVRAGERSGRLASALGVLAASLERERRLRAELLGALTYPAVVGAVGLVSVGLLFVLVLPAFGDLLADAGVPLPASTQLLLSIGDFLKSQWLKLLLTAVLALVAARAWNRTPAGRAQLHAVLLGLPVVGLLRRKFAAVQVGTCLSNMLSQGAPALRAMSVCQEVVTDEVVRSRLQQAEEDVRSGGRLAQALAACKCFPPTFLHLVEIGEEGGRLPELLERAATLAERELHDYLQALVRLAEPTMILFFGGLVGFVALALLQAVYGIQAVGL